MLGRKRSLLLSFLSVQWINKPQVPTVVSPALFTRTGILSNTDDVGSIKSLLRIAVQTSLWVFYNIYLWASHILSTEVTQTGTLFSTTTFLSSHEYKTWIRVGLWMPQKNVSDELRLWNLSGRFWGWRKPWWSLIGFCFPLWTFTVWTGISV